MSARDELATAAEGADGVNKVWPNYKQDLNPGNGWVHWAGANRAENGFGYVDTWQVLIVLPQDMQKAERWINDHAFAIADALDGPMDVTKVEPEQLIINGPAVPVLTIEGVRGRD